MVAADLIDYFGFREQSPDVASPAFKFDPVTFPPIAMPPQFASTPADDFEGDGGNA
jgi:hypothetical protein